MSAVPSRERLGVPSSLREQLLGFRRRLWSTKMIEALAFAAAGLLLAFLTVFFVDRLVDTPMSIRLAIFITTLLTWTAIPWALYRWVWLHTRLDQLARLMRLREPMIGDQLLSVIELAENDGEQARSRALCAAAIAQVAEAARHRDLRVAVPPSRVKLWCIVATASLIAAVGLAGFSPEATRNAWARLAAPWIDTPRYTFTDIENLPSTMVLAHGERAALSVELTQSSRWEPSRATLEFKGLPVITSQVQQRAYRFVVPPQTAPVMGKLRVGDYVQEIRFEPKMRPELIAALGEIQLPEYLKLTEPVESDVRGGTLSVVSGSTARVHATASRTLQDAAVNEQMVDVTEASFQSSSIAIGDAPQSLLLRWRDRDGLTGREPFQLAVQPIADEAPSVVSQELPRRAVLLDSEQINFAALAADDFGVKRIGMSWQGLDDRLPLAPAKGEKIISLGGPDKSSMQVPATFSAKSLDIPAQPLEVRLWVEDYLPERERMYSPPHTLFILTPEQHAIWITDQLSKWHKAALDVRDRELQLHETNKRLREMSPDELADEELRKELRAQAAAESQNGRRLAGLSKNGEQLLRKAARNPELGVGHLERWAEMLQVLNDISTNRMPSVADLLGKASAEVQLARAKDALPAGPSAGRQRTSPGGAGKPPDEIVPTGKPPLPSVVDNESSLQPPDNKPGEGEGPKKKFGGRKFTLPQTTLVGPGKDAPKPEQDEPPADEEPAVDKALFEQEELLAEFERIAEEMNAVLAQLEGSTLVKRLKAASREQADVAQGISGRIDGFFGRSTPSHAKEDSQLLGKLVKVEEASSQTVSYIMDDMQSYFERRRMNQFKVILDDMRKLNVTGALKDIADSLPKEQGMSIAQAEYWADTLDRWAEDLVDPACSGSCPGSKTSDALPPSVILEILQILEGEVNLREATRVAEQAKAGKPAEVHVEESTQLGTTQETLQGRTERVTERIGELPEAERRFEEELDLLRRVSVVMKDAAGILAAGDTGAPAMAAETEAIELLLQSKRINPKSGGGGGSTPGGGGGGDTQDAALALLGSGLNQKEKREQRDVTQATGEAGRVLPEEFRAGLDEYFNRLESGL